MKKILLGIIIVICLFPFFSEAEDNLNHQQVLFDLMDSLEGKTDEVDISVNGIVHKGFMEAYELDKIGQGLVSDIGIIGQESDDISNGEGYIKEITDENGYRQISYYGYNKYGDKITFILTSYLDVDTNGETYLYINFMKREHFLEINDIIITVKNIYDKFGEKADITTCLIGSFDGKLDEKYVEMKGINAIDKIKGKMVDIYKDDNLVSFTAYTPYIEDNITAGEDKINLNLALRYNKYENKTAIWIGTPIIAGGY